MATGNCSIVLLDGGLATELEQRGYVIQDDPLWSARLLSTKPQAIKDIHKSYLASGAEIIITASYQASVPGFMKYLGVSSEEAKSLVTLSIQLARQAIEEHLTEREILHSRQIQLYGIGQCSLPLIAGSIGPYGACLHDGSEYTGSYIDKVTKQELKDWHHQRIALLYGEGLRLFACETIPVQLEAEAIVEVINEFSDAVCWISFCCKDGLHVCHGETLVDAVSSIVHSPQVIAVGVNCTAPQHVESLLKSICQCSAGRTLLAYPNSGEEWIDSRWQAQKGSPLSLVSYLQSWIDAGARLIGSRGCCRTRPGDIQSFRKAIDAIQN